MTDVELRSMRQEAMDTGKCPCCGHVVKVYEYGLGPLYVGTLKQIYQRVFDSGHNDVDVGDLSLTYAERSTLSILRFNGLIAKVKDDDGHQLRRHWLITRNGARFLRNQLMLPAKVRVYNNKVIGHVGKQVSVIDVLGYDPRIVATEPFERAPAEPSVQAQAAML